MDTIRTFFPKIAALFLIFKKGQGKPPLLPSPSYAPADWLLERMVNLFTVLISAREDIKNSTKLNYMKDKINYISNFISNC